MDEKELNIVGEGASIACHTGADNCRQCIHVKYNIPALMAEIRRYQRVKTRIEKIVEESVHAPMVFGPLVVQILGEE
jgi:hypothetical protein